MPNNKLESLHSKYKQLIEHFSSLANLIRGIFQFVQSQTIENDSRVANAMIKRPVILQPITNDEQNFLTAFMPAVHVQIKNELETSLYVDLRKVTTADDSFEVKSRDVILQVTPLSCECSSYKNGIPCRHLLAVRREMGLPIFDKDLCTGRWVKLKILEEVSTACDFLPSVVTRTVKSRKAKTPMQKFSNCRRITDEIASVTSFSCGEAYKAKVNSIKLFLEYLKQDIDVVISEKSKSDDLVERLAGIHLSTSEPRTDEDGKVPDTDEKRKLSAMTMPKAFKFRGRPSKYKATFISTKAKRSPVKNHKDLGKI